MEARQTMSVIAALVPEALPSVPAIGRAVFDEAVPMGVSNDRSGASSDRAEPGSGMAAWLAVYDLGSRAPGKSHEVAAVDTAAATGFIPRWRAPASSAT